MRYEIECTKGGSLLLPLLQEGETIAQYTLDGIYHSLYAIVKKGSYDASCELVEKALKDTLHRLIENDMSDDVYVITGMMHVNEILADEAQEGEYSEYSRSSRISIDLGYCLRYGYILSWDFMEV